MEKRITFFLVLFSLVGTGCDPNPSCEIRQKERSDMSFCVIIEKKSRNGRSFSVIGKDYNGKKTKIEETEYQLSVAVGDAEIGDTLYKASGTLDFYLKKKGKTLKYTYYCNI